MKNISYLESITYALIVAGYIVALVIPQGAGSISGYATVVVGLFTLIMLKMVPLTHMQELKWQMFSGMIPMIVVLGISIWLLTINIKFSKHIEKGNVPKDYTMFSVLSFILLFLQLILIYKDDYDTTSWIVLPSWIISFLASFQFIIVFIMQMNLEYFITDG